MHATRTKRRIITGKQSIFHCAPQAKTKLSGIILNIIVISSAVDHWIWLYKISNAVTPLICVIMMWN